MPFHTFLPVFAKTTVAIGVVAASASSRGYTNTANRDFEVVSESRGKGRISDWLKNGLLTS